jgi:hypothetical protein
VQGLVRESLIATSERRHAFSSRRAQYTIHGRSEGALYAA